MVRQRGAEELQEVPKVQCCSFHSSFIQVGPAVPIIIARYQHMHTSLQVGLPCDLRTPSLDLSGSLS